MIDNRIIKFIGKHHVFTLATVAGDAPWCCNCFYAYLKDANLLVFTSDYKTRHVVEAQANPRVAGTIVLETSVVGKIQGIQFTGTMYRPEGSLQSIAENAYMSRFPFARLMDTTIWVVDLELIKMTDNLLGFGKKLIWEKS